MINVRSAAIAMAVLAACSGGGADDAKAYARKSKEIEARLQLNLLSKALRTMHAELGTLPAGTAGPSPSTPCCEGAGGRCPAVAADWEHPVWRQLDFAPTEPLRFQYSYQSDGTSFTLAAVGDVNCDGKPSSFKVTGAIAGDQLTVDDHEIAAPRR